MRILKTLAMLLALCLPTLGATTWPASTNANQTFFGTNTFTKPIQGTATNALKAVYATTALKPDTISQVVDTLVGIDVAGEFSITAIDSGIVNSLGAMPVTNALNAVTSGIATNDDLGNKISTNYATVVYAQGVSNIAQGAITYATGVSNNLNTVSNTVNGAIAYTTGVSNLVIAATNNFNGANIAAGTINSNKLDTATAAQLALAGSGGGDVFKAGNNSFSGSNYFTGTEYMAGAVRMADGSLIATNMTARTNDPAANALTTYGNAEVKGTLTSAAFSGLGASLTGISSNSLDAPTKAQLALAGSGSGITALTGDGTASGSGSVALSVSNITPGFTISSGQYLKRSGSGWVGDNPTGSGDVVSTNINTFTKSNYFASDLTVGGNLYINGTNSTTSLSNLVVGGTLVVTGAVTGASFSGSGAGLTGIPGSAVSGASSITNGLLSVASAAATYLPLAGGTVSGAVLTTSSTTNSPGATELASAGWVRNLLVGTGTPFYNTSVVDAGATNTGSSQVVYQYASTIPASGSHSYASGFLTNNGYLGSVITTNQYHEIGGQVSVAMCFGWAGGSGTRSLSYKYELYVSSDKTNWFGDWSSPVLTIGADTTNYANLVIDVPNTVATNTSGYYIERRLKITAITFSGTPTAYVLVGTNSLTGVSDAGHITLPSATANSGNAYLAADQVWTGNNTFGNFTASVVTNSALTASRVVLSDANKKEVSATASGAVPIDADGTATTGGQITNLLTGAAALNGAQIVGTVPAATVVTTATLTNGVYGTNIVDRAIYATNAYNGVSLDATKQYQIFTTNASFTIAGFTGLVSGSQHAFSICYSNSATTNIVITGPPTSAYVGSVSTKTFTLTNATEGVWSFWIRPNLRTNTANCWATAVQ